jgi:hypothetical protein
MRIELPIEDLIQKTLELEDLGAQVLKEAKMLGFRAYAMPRVPDKLKPHLQVEYQGNVYDLSDPRLREIDEDELKLLPPTEIDNLQDDTLFLMLQYFSAQEATQETVLGELKNDMELKKAAWKQTVDLRKLSLMGAINPETGKTYTDAARSESSASDPAALKAYSTYLRAKALYDIALSLHTGCHRITESLNRQRMAREEKRYPSPFGNRQGNRPTRPLSRGPKDPPPR